MDSTVMAWLDDAGWRTMLGVSRVQFHWVFGRYCGLHTPIRTPFKLFRLLYWLRHYPTELPLCVLFHIPRRRNFSKWLKRSVTYLGAVIRDVVADNWERRHAVANPASWFWPGPCLGAIDTMPIYVRRPRSHQFGRFLYN